MNPYTALLVELNGTEQSLVDEKLSEARRADGEARIAKIREQIPEQILGHYDRLKRSNKIPVVEVRNGICLGCHLTLTRGLAVRLQSADDLHICEHCGRYIYIRAADKPAEPVVTPKRGKRRSMAAITA